MRSVISLLRTGGGRAHVGEADDVTVKNGWSVGEHRAGPARRRPAAGFALVLGVGLTAACGESGGTQEAAASTAASSTSATTASTSAAPTSSTTSSSTPVTAPAPTTKTSVDQYPKTPEGAEAFVRAFLGAYNTASKDPTTAGALRSYYESSCTPCEGIYSGVSSYAQRGIRQTNEAITVLRARTEPNGDQQVVLVAVRQNAGKLVDKRGITKSQIPAVAEDPNAFILRWRSDGWAVVDMKEFRGEI